MGWTGTWKDTCPHGADRVRAAITQEGYEFTEADRHSEVIASALRGTTVYLAVRYTQLANSGTVVTETYGAVIRTAYDPHRGEFLTKGISEDMGPVAYDCPKRILDLLTPANSEYAKDWRARCTRKRLRQ